MIHEKKKRTQLETQLDNNTTNKQTNTTNIQKKPLDNKNFRCWDQKDKRCRSKVVEFQSCNKHKKLYQWLPWAALKIAYLWREIASVFCQTSYMVDESSPLLQHFWFRKGQIPTPFLTLVWCKWDAVNSPPSFDRSLGEVSFHVDLKQKAGAGTSLDGNPRRKIRYTGTTWSF